MIFSLRQIQEKAIEQYEELFIVFVDFKKAFDTIDSKMLLKVVKEFGCPDHFVEIIKQFHEGNSILPNLLVFSTIWAVTR